MNMPTHIRRKAAQVPMEGVTTGRRRSSCRLLIGSGVQAARRPRRARAFRYESGLRAPRRSSTVKISASSGRCKRERKQRDLSGDDRIVGMRKISVGPRRHQRLAWQHDDARGPSRPQRGKDPQPQALQHDEARKCRENDVLIAAPDPQGDQPRRMNRHDQRIVTGADLDRTARQQPACVVAGQNEFTQSLQRDQQENG